ncbi:MAG: MFS transporter [Oligoflexales bacterium]
MSQLEKESVSWFSFLWFVVILLVVEMEKEIVLPAIPHLMAAFEADYAVAQMVLSINLLGFALSCVSCYGLVRVLSYRAVMLLSYIGFNMGSVFSCSQSSLGLLVAGRFLQGLSGGYLFIIIFALLPMCYDRHKSERLLGFVNGVVCLTTGLAPLIGVLLIEYRDWAACFQCVVLLSFCATLGFPWAQNLALNAPQLSTEQSLKESYKSLIRSPCFVASASIPALMLGCYLVYIAYAPFLYQQTLKDQNGQLLYTVTQMGIMFGFAGLCFSSEKICAIFGHRRVETVMTCCSVFCGFLLVGALWFAESYPLFLVVVSILTFSFQGIPFNNAMARTVRVLPDLETQASSLAMFLKLLSGSVFLWLTSLLGESPLEGTVVMLGVLFGFTLIPACSRFMYDEDLSEESIEELSDLFALETCSMSV